MRAQITKDPVRSTDRDADANVMSGFMRQEPAAAEDLYDRFASRIYGLGLVLLRDATDAEDLVQDTFLKVWRLGSAFDPDRGSLDTWILLNARSLAIDLLRRRSVEARKLAEQPKVSEVSDEPGPEWHAETGDLLERANRAMGLLPQGQRTALELTYLGERSTREVAELEGVPRGTVKSRVHAGLVSLQKVFGPDDDAA